MRVHETARALRYLVVNPAEALDRARDKVDHIADRGRSASDAHAYEPTPDAERGLHEQIGIPLPCQAGPEFENAWNGLEQSFAGSQSFVGDWDHDADPGLARILWCLVRHLRPQRVVETGVARGVTTRIQLEALERNGEGRLWSIDLPYLRSAWYDQTAVAVPPSSRSRWTYVRGSSRRRLPKLLAELGQIDLFLHDGSHTESNMRFEFETAWPTLRPGGALVSHDITWNAAFARFASSVPSDPLSARYEGGTSMVGVLVKSG